MEPEQDFGSPDCLVSAASFSWVAQTPYLPSHGIGFTSCPQHSSWTPRTKPKRDVASRRPRLKRVRRELGPSYQRALQRAEVGFSRKSGFCLPFRELQTLLSLLFPRSTDIPSPSFSELSLWSHLILTTILEEKDDYLRYTEKTKAQYKQAPGKGQNSLVSSFQLLYLSLAQTTSGFWFREFQANLLLIDS